MKLFKRIVTLVLTVCILLGFATMVVPQASNPSDSITLESAQLLYVGWHNKKVRLTFSDKVSIPDGGYNIYLASSVNGGNCSNNDGSWQVHARNYWSKGYVEFHDSEVKGGKTYASVIDLYFSHCCDAHKSLWNDYKSNAIPEGAVVYLTEANDTSKFVGINGESLRTTNGAKAHVALTAAEDPIEDGIYTIANVSTGNSISVDGDKEIKLVKAPEQGAGIYAVTKSDGVTPIGLVPDQWQTYYPATASDTQYVRVVDCGNGQYRLLGHIPSSSKGNRFSKTMAYDDGSGTADQVALNIQHLDADLSSNATNRSNFTEKSLWTLTKKVEFITLESAELLYTGWHNKKVRLTFSDKVSIPDGGYNIYLAGSIDGGNCSNNDGGWQCHARNDWNKGYVEFHDSEVVGGKTYASVIDLYFSHCCSNHKSLWDDYKTNTIPDGAVVFLTEADNTTKFVGINGEPIKTTSGTKAHVALTAAEDPIEDGIYTIQNADTGNSISVDGNKEIKLVKASDQGDGIYIVTTADGTTPIGLVPDQWQTYYPATASDTQYVRVVDCGNGQYQLLGHIPTSSKGNRFSKTFAYDDGSGTADQAALNIQHLDVNLTTNATAKENFEAKSLWVLSKKSSPITLESAELLYCNSNHKRVRLTFSDKVHITKDGIAAMTMDEAAGSVAGAKKWFDLGYITYIDKEVVSGVSYASQIDVYFEWKADSNKTAWGHQGSNKYNMTVPAGTKVYLTDTVVNGMLESTLFVGRNGEQVVVTASSATQDVASIAVTMPKEPEIESGAQYSIKNSVTNRYVVVNGGNNFILTYVGDGWYTVQNTDGTKYIQLSGWSEVNDPVEVNAEQRVRFISCGEDQYQIVYGDQKNSTFIIDSYANTEVTYSQTKLQYNQNNQSASNSMTDNTYWTLTEVNAEEEGGTDQVVTLDSAVLLYGNTEHKRVRLTFSDKVALTNPAGMNVISMVEATGCVTNIKTWSRDRGYISYIDGTDKGGVTYASIIDVWFGWCGHSEHKSLWGSDYMTVPADTRICLSDSVSNDDGVLSRSLFVGINGEAVKANTVSAGKDVASVALTQADEPPIESGQTYSITNLDTGREVVVDGEDAFTLTYKGNGLYTITNTKGNYILLFGWDEVVEPKRVTSETMLRLIDCGNGKYQMIYEDGKNTKFIIDPAADMSLTSAQTSYQYNQEKSSANSLAENTYWTLAKATVSGQGAKKELKLIKAEAIADNALVMTFSAPIEITSDPYFCLRWFDAQDRLVYKTEAGEYVFTNKTDGKDNSPMQWKLLNWEWYNKEHTQIRLTMSHGQMGMQNFVDILSYDFSKEIEGGYLAVGVEEKTPDAKNGNFYIDNIRMAGDAHVALEATKVISERNYDGAYLKGLTCAFTPKEVKVTSMKVINDVQIRITFSEPVDMIGDMNARIRFINEETKGQLHWGDDYNRTSVSFWGKLKFEDASHRSLIWTMNGNNVFGTCNISDVVNYRYGLTSLKGTRMQFFIEEKSVEDGLQIVGKNNRIDNLVAKDGANHVMATHSANPDGLKWDNFDAPVLKGKGGVQLLSVKAIDDQTLEVVFSEGVIIDDTDENLSMVIQYLSPSGDGEVLADGRSATFKGNWKYKDDNKNVILWTLSSKHAENLTQIFNYEGNLKWNADARVCFIIKNDNEELPVKTMRLWGITDLSGYRHLECRLMEVATIQADIEIGYDKPDRVVNIDQNEEVPVEYYANYTPFVVGGVILPIGSSAAALLIGRRKKEGK